MQPKIVVIHHSADFDGIFCREIARRHFGDDAEYIGWDYGQPEPSVPDNAALYMLDISVPGLMNHPRLNWVDHHKSAMERYGQKPGYQIDGVAACRLSWQYFGGVNNWSGRGVPAKADFVERRVKEPWAVRLAGEYDIWDKRDPDAELFQHGLRGQSLDGLWPQLLQVDEIPTIAQLEAVIDAGFQNVLNPDGTCRNHSVSGLLDKGRAIQFAKTRENENIIKNAGFTVEFEGLTFLACNHGRYNSHLFTAGLKENHDACLGFNYDGLMKNWKVSLYHAPGKEHHDLSHIAVRYGGGGHRGACGFRVKKLPFIP